MRLLSINLPTVYSEGLFKQFREQDARCRFDVASSVSDARSRLRFHRFDLVILDLAQANNDSLVQLKRVAEYAPTCPIVVVSESSSAQWLQNLKENGASGFVQKSEPGDALLRVVHAVLARRRETRNVTQTIRPNAVCADSNHESSDAREQTATRRLTPRQLQVLSSLAQGKPNKLIARDLDVSENTVKAHLKTVFRVLGASNRTEAVTQATRMRLVSY